MTKHHGLSSKHLSEYETATLQLTDMDAKIKELKAERDDARRQAATYAAHIEDLSAQVDELRAERDELADALYKTVKQYTENGYIDGHAITRAEKLTGKATDE